MPIMRNDISEISNKKRGVAENLCSIDIVTSNFKENKRVYMKIKYILLYEDKIHSTTEL